MNFDDLGEANDDDSDHKVFKNKHKVDQSKIENKRKQKEAKKKIKINKSKGIIEIEAKKEN